MSMPPEDVEPTDLFQRLAAREPPSEVVDYPSDDVDEKIRIVGLDVEDLEPKTISARKWIKDTYKLSEADLETSFWDLRVQQRTAREILADTILRPNPIPGSEATEKGVQYPYLFHGDPEKVAKLPPREVGILWALWNLVQNRISPTESMLSSPDQVKAWVDVLKEGARPFGFFQLELPQQEALLSSLLQWASCLVELLSSLPTPLPDNWESILENYGFDIGWCSGLAASSTQLTPASEPDPREPIDETFSAEEGEQRARDMLKVARKIADDTRE